MIKFFRNKYFFMSNFYQAPVMFDGLLYTNNEAAFQSAKVADIERRTNLNTSKGVIDFTKLTPAQAKAVGKKVDLREDWEEIKDQVMYDIVYDKFSRNKDLKEQLLATGDKELIESNTWNDTYWGVCRGVGKNMLGKILMRVRSELKMEGV